MTNKHKKAQEMLDALELVDENMLQQAYTTDTPEKFRALGRVKAAKIRKERPVTALRRWSAVAACLAIAIALACLPWVFSGLLPLLDDPSISQQTQPTQTTVPTEPTVPSTPTQPKTEIRLFKSMEIWFHTDKMHLFCSYFTNSDVFYPGQTVSVTLYVKNAGAAIDYIGAFEDQFGTAQLRSDSDSNYTITSLEKPNTDDATAQEFAHLEAGSYTYQFVIPQDAPEGNYTLEVSTFGSSITFNLEATNQTKYIPVLADLPEDIQKLILGEANYNTANYQRHKNDHVYGEFDSVYVLKLSGWAEMVFTCECVNGLTFHYGSTLQITVHTVEGVYSMQEAFDRGILSTEQLQEIYDNYYLANPHMKDRI